MLVGSFRHIRSDVAPRLHQLEEDTLRDGR
jgi:hypothetical protein